MILSPAVILLDQFTKYWITLKLPVGGKITVLKNYFDIVHVRNQGAAFGMLSQWDSGIREWFFYGVSILAMLALFFLYRKSKENERRIHIPLALILGGAIGNLIDRVTRGDVVDFLRFHWQNKVADLPYFGKVFLSWPSFNVADIAITCGAIYLVIVILLFETRTKGSI